MATNYLLDPVYQDTDQEDFTNWGGASYDLGGNTNLGSTSDLLSTSDNALTSPDFTFGGSYASENLGSDNALNSDYSEALGGGDYTFGSNTPDPVDAEAQKSGSPLNGVKGAVSTFDTWMKKLLGPDGAQKLYSGAIMAGATAILQSMKSDSDTKIKTADREDKQEHDKELKSMDYAREDEARRRKNKVSTRAGLLNYQSNYNKGYQVPGAANTQQYGLLGSK